MMCNSAKRVFVCACKGTWQVDRVSLPNQLLKRLCRNAHFFFQRKQSHFPSGQVTRLEPPESSGSPYGAISPDMINLVRALHSQQPIKLFEIMLLYSPHKLFGDELIFARQTVRWESVDELAHTPHNTRLN